jgi:hypothetical protein
MPSVIDHAPLSVTLGGPEQERLVMFSKQFRERIAKYKYARWAVDLTEDDLEALLWAVGEYGIRSEKVLPVLQSHLPRDPVAHARAVFALEVLAELVRGHHTSVDRYCERARERQSCL